MSDVKVAIMDAAERRMQTGGFNGFSFRDVAADIGIKSSSVHYHFPKKEDLAAAIIRRCSECTAVIIDQALDRDPDPIRAWIKVFQTTRGRYHINPWTVLGVYSEDLPEQVAIEVKHFFNMCQDKLIAEGLSPGKAASVLSTLVGATVVANALHDTTAYDRAIKDLLSKPKAKAA
jgi:TetR/AcrR family transcriptional regulator, transcriptional repressor for nem operon